MKTQKQVMNLFYGFLKRYSVLNTICGIDTYRSEDGKFWTVTLKVSKYVGGEMKMFERFEWMHYSHQTEEEETANETNLAEFIKRVEEQA